MAELTKHEKISLGTKEIAKLIRTQLKEEFPDCTFSVRMQSYSGGSSITVYLVKADRKIKLRFNEIPERALCSYHANRYTEDEIKRAQEREYHQLGHFYRDYDINSWNNGVFLTYQGYQLLKRVEQIADQYNYNDSDIQIDYYSVNFSFSLDLGNWELRIDARLEEIEENNKKEKELEKIKRIEEDQWRKENKNKPSIPTTATHVIDGSGLRELTQEERETSKSKENLEKKWFNGSVNWKNFTLEL
jgi:hypothetical protein